MYCKNLTKKMNGKLRCKIIKQEITLEYCEKCRNFQSRENKPIKKRTSKLQKLEKNRFSILTDDLEHCYWCYELDFSKVKRDDLHEIYGGRNRKISMQNGFVVPLCRKHHESEYIKNYLKKLCQTTYENNHTREEFMSLIGENYL